MANKVGRLIKEARTAAGLTQEQLARKVRNTSAADISKAERGELRLSQEALKQIAKATGVTQKSLLDAAATSSYKKASSSSASSGSSGSTSTTSMRLTAAEKKIIEKYRKADADTKKQVRNLLDKSDLANDVSDTIGGLLESAFDMLSKR